MLVQQFVQNFLLPNPLLAAGVAAAFLYATGLLYLVARSRFRSGTGYAFEHEITGSTAQNYFRYAAEGLIVTGTDGKIVEINPRARWMFGYGREELFGEPFETLIADQSREAYARQRADYLRSRSRAAGAGLDLGGRRKDGTEFPAHICLSFVPGDGGDLVIASITDVAQRLADERETRRSELQAVLGAVVAGVAHELSNPMSVICTRIELVRQQMGRLDVPPQIRNDLRIIEHHSLRAGRIAHELLTLARERPKERMRFVDVNDVVDRVLMITADQVIKTGIRIDVILDRSLAPVLGDATALEQVLVNLLVNARDAMRDGGVIRLETGAIAGKPGWLYLAVADTGCGVEAENLARLFELFYTTKATGTGMGLWLSRRIVLEHRGTIEAHSEAGKGTTLVVSLPQIEADSALVAKNHAHN